MEIDGSKREKTKGFKASVIRSKGSQFILGSKLPPTLILMPLHNTFKNEKRFELYDKIKVGRQVSPKTVPEVNNGFFDSKVLSRSHAEIWAEGEKVFIKDVKSSNGTYLNGNRLSGDGQESLPKLIFNGDVIEFGIDIFNENGTILYQKISAKAKIINATINDAMFNESNEVKETLNYETKKSDSLKELVKKNNERKSIPIKLTEQHDMDIKFNTTIHPTKVSSINKPQKVVEGKIKSYMELPLMLDNVMNGLQNEVEVTSKEKNEIQLLQEEVMVLSQIYTKQIGGIHMKYQHEIQRVQQEVQLKDEKYQRLQEMSSKREVQLLDESQQILNNFKKCQEELKQAKISLNQNESIIKSQKHTIQLQNEAIDELQKLIDNLNTDLNKNGNKMNDANKDKEIKKEDKKDGFTPQPIRTKPSSDIQAI